MWVSLIIGVLISLIVITTELGMHFFKQWKSSLIEVEKYKSESLQSQLQSLKTQVNPHFLFNNLSVLSSLVYISQDKAVDFINQLSKVYRYILQGNQNQLIKLEEELAFIKSYTYLLKIRFDKNIDFSFDELKSQYGKYIPPMSLQILIENCIQHNEISSKNPLSVKISSTNDYLIVSNNFQPKIKIQESANIGLKNITERYKYFTEQKIEIDNDNVQFTVKIPLIEQ